MNTPQDRAGEDLVQLESILGRKPEKEQVQLLKTSVRAALVRQYTVQAENSTLRAEIDRTEALFLNAHRRNQATLAAYQASLERTLAATRAQCEQRLRDMTDELGKARRAIVAAEEERDLLFATIVEHIGRLPPLPLLADPEVETSPPGSSSVDIGFLPTTRTARSVFRDKEQECSAIRTLLRSVGLERLWTECGPTAEANALRDENGESLSLSQRVILLAAYDLWSRQGGLRLVELLACLHREPTHALLTLLLAAHVNWVAVDHWLSDSADEPVALRC